MVNFKRDITSSRHIFCIQVEDKSFMQVYTALLERTMATGYKSLYDLEASIYIYFSLCGSAYLNSLVAFSSLFCDYDVLG